MNTLDLFTMNAPSPFDSIRQLREDGTEYWSARDLQPLLGYTEWRKFVDSIVRAEDALLALDGQTDDHFVGAAKLVQIGSGAGRTINDMHLSRFGAYLVAMNGDPRKPEIAAAQTYFAQQTRRAEIAQATPQFEIPATYADALRLAADQSEQIERQKAEIAEAERSLAIAAPKVEAHDQFLAAEGCLTMDQVAKSLDIGRTTLYRRLREAGVIEKRGTLPMQKYAHHFDVVHGTYTRGGVEIPYTTTRVRPSGVTFIYKKLGEADARQTLQLIAGGVA